MRKIFISAIILAMSMIIYSDSEITFEKRKISFGEIKSGEVVDLVFKFKNTGDKILVIKSINTSCGCTYTRNEKKEYQPGEKGTIPVKFFSKGYRGKVVKTINVSTNDKKNPYIRLLLDGIVTLKDFSVVQADKDFIDFGRISIKEKSSKDIVIKNPGTIDLRILEITHSPEVSTVFTKKIIKPGESGLLTVTFSPFQIGQFSTFLRIRTNAFKSPLLIIRLKTDITEAKKE